MFRNNLSLSAVNCSLILRAIMISSVLYFLPILFCKSAPLSVGISRVFEGSLA